MIRRRGLLTLLAVAAAWPLAARAQQAMPVIGFLSGRSPVEAASAVDAFRRGLGEIGYIEGQSVTIEYRWAEGHYDRLPALAAELVARQVAVIAATGGEASGLAAKATTATIPIVFTMGGDPVELGLVVSLNKPGGNVTGVTFIVGDIATKRLGLLRQLVPNATTITMLVNPNYPATSAEVRDVQAAARTMGLHIDLLTAGTSGEIDAALATFVRKRPDALFVGGDPFLLGQRDQIASLAAHHAVPTIYPQREYVDAGGLMSYGTSVPNGYRQAGVYTGRILRGAKPAELPVLQPTNLELAINLKTAKALGLDVPDKLLAIADEVIE
jgi:putative ABC transport system substrate-binding protein